MVILKDGIDDDDESCIIHDDWCYWMMNDTDDVGDEDVGGESWLVMEDGGAWIMNDNDDGNDDDNGDWWWMETLTYDEW